MGPDIIIPVVVIAVAVPTALVLAKRYLRDPTGRDHGEPVLAPGVRLTSKALRELPTPPWRVVYEIGPQRLAGVEHVLIGPAGVFAVQTSMDPLPDTMREHDAVAIAQAAIVRGGLDDALRRCAMTSDRLVRVHWGVGDGRASIDDMPGVVAVDGRSLTSWVASLDGSLSPAQVDLAWQTVTVAIGRPDPLA